MTSSVPSAGMGDPEVRAGLLDAITSGGGPRTEGTLSVETLVDVLLVLYDECWNSSLRIW